MAAVLVLYHSQQHGNTQAMAQAVAEGAQDAGADVELVNTNQTRLDIERYRAVDAVGFGTPDYYSYLAGGLKVFLDDWYIAGQADRRSLDDKPYGLFYSHGGGGAVKEVLPELFGRRGSRGGETIASRGAPSAAVLEECRQLGRQLASAAA